MGSATDTNAGDYFRLKNEIFMVVRKGVIAVGTHSHTRIKFAVRNINGGGEKQMVFSHEDKLESVDVKRTKGQVVVKGADSVQVMDLFSYETVEAGVEPELLAELREGDTVTITDIEGKKMIMDKLRSA